MTGEPGRRRFWSPRAIALALGIVALFIAANLHLVAVSIGSEPGCVPHAKAPGGGAAGFRAASPSC